VFIPEGIVKNNPVELIPQANLSCQPFNFALFTVPSGMNTLYFPYILEVNGMSDLVWDGRVRQGQDKSIYLQSTMVSKLIGNANLNLVGQYITVNNISSQSFVEWDVEVNYGGKYCLFILASSANSAVFATVTTGSNQKHAFMFPQTNSINNFITYNTTLIFNVEQGQSRHFKFQILRSNNNELKEEKKNNVINAPQGFQLVSVNLLPVFK